MTVGTPSEWATITTGLSASLTAVGDIGRPVLAHRLRPFGLLDAAGGRQLRLPAGLPVVRTGIGVARHDQYVGVLDFHGRACSQHAAGVQPSARADAAEAEQRVRCFGACANASRPI